MEVFSDTSQKKQRIAIYIRVSTQEQKIDGFGLESQKRRLLDYINGNKALNLYTQEDWIFEDVHTGSEIIRPGLQKLLGQVDQKKFDSVLVWKIDRLSRSLKHLLEIFERLQKASTSFISLQENINFNGAIGNLIFQIFGAIAQFERELIKSRTRAGLLASAEMGNYTGTNIPYAYKPLQNPSGKGKKLEIIPQEKKWIEKIFNWYIYEDMGYGQVANKLNELGVSLGKHHAKDGTGRWTASRIEDIISNTVYHGEYVAAKKGDDGNMLPEEDWTVVDIPPCVSETIFMLAQEKRKERRGSRQSEYIYLLSGKLCDASLPRKPKFSGKPRTKGGRSYRRKQFNKDGKHYPVFEIPAESIENAVWEKLKTALEEPEIFIKEYFNNKRYGRSRLDDLNEELLSLRKKEAELQLKLDRIESAYENGSYGQEKMNTKISHTQVEINHIDDRIQEITKELSIASFGGAEIIGLRKAAESVKYNLDHLGRKQRQMLINLFIDRVEMNRTELPSDGKRKKWDVTAKVIFRFVPGKFSKPMEKGSTQKPQGTKKKPSQIPYEGSSGRGAGT